MIIKYIAAPVIGAVTGYFTNFIAVKMLFHPKKEIRVFGHRIPFTPGAIPKGKPRLARSVGNAVGNNLITKADIEEKLLSDDLAGKIADMVLVQFSLPINSLLSELPGISAEDIESKKENVSQAIARYISEALSKVDFAGLIVEKVPGIIKAKLNNPMIEMFLTDELLQSVLAPVGDELQAYIAEHGEEFIAPYVWQKLSDSEDISLADIMEQLSIDGSQLRSVIMALYKKAVAGCSDELMKWLDLGSIVEDKINAMSADELEALVMSVMKKELNTIVNLGALIGFVLGLLNLFF
ncbi:MAG: DUF445 domain-containing protein [Oscillospiraceae bacterium]